MKQLSSIFVLWCSLTAANAATIWQENFNCYTNVGVTGLGPTNYPGGVTNWSIDVRACATLNPGSGSTGDYFMAVSTGGGRMEAVNVDGEAVWASAVVNISGYTNVSLSAVAAETGSSTSTNKYVKLFYRLDGGAETAFAGNPANVGNWSSATATQSNLCGATVQVIARMNNPNLGDKSILDTVTVSGDGIVAWLPPVLDAIGDRNVVEMGSLSFTVTASDPANNDPITLTATNLPTGAAFTNGVFTWSNAAPAGAYAVTFYATDKDGADSETITITVAPRPHLIISEVADPSGTGGDAWRFVELYNAGAGTINLSADHWHLSKQVNGGTWYDIPLTGSVPSSAAWVIACNASEFEVTYGRAPEQESGYVSGNGDDAYFLYCGGTHSNGVLIDIYGELNTDGTDTAWDYEDSRAVRNSNILEPNSVWTAAEWTVTSGAETNVMTPGMHGPLPQFKNLTDPFVFLGDNLNLTVTAVNTVRTDIIRLTATALPAGAVFPATTGTSTVSSTLSWIGPTSGTYRATFAAAGLAGTNIASVTITVSNRSRIAGNFYGWSGDTIFKLENGQFWQQSAAGAKTVSPALYKPYMTITNIFGQRRMTVTNVTGYAVVEPLTVTEDAVTNDFTGLHYQNIYQFADGTAWKQISFENISSSAAPVTVWRWINGDQQMLRFLDRNGAVIGTCTVEPAGAPVNAPIVSAIDGYFRGWQSRRVFALANGQFWQQTSLDDSPQTLYRPAVTVTNWLQTGIWRMSVSGLAGFVDVQQLSNVTRTAINGTFYGFGQGRIFNFTDGTWWKQTSLESSVSIRRNPEVLIYNDCLELPDEGLRVAAKKLNVQSESAVTNTFTGLHYGNLYQLADGRNWLQLSFENIRTNVPEPQVMLWMDETGTNLLVRDSLDVTVGTCTVVDPALDADSDGLSNADEVTAGSDPNDPKSTLLTSVLCLPTSGRVLRWDAAEGRVYSIEWTPSLPESFQILETGIVWPQNSWTDTVHTVETKGYYRITVRLAE